MKIVYPFKKVAVLVWLLLFFTRLAFAQPPADVPLSWLYGNPVKPTGVSWGVSWKQSQVKINSVFALFRADGTPMPVQTWPLAYWPDGSVKWTGFAYIADSSDKNLTLSMLRGKAKSAIDTSSLHITEDVGNVQISAGKLKCAIAKSGSLLMPFIRLNGKEVATDGKLECLLQNQADGDIESAVGKEKYISNILGVTVEQSGPLRAVVCVNGDMKAVSGNRKLLPFIIRFYFYAGLSNIRVVYTLLYNGDEQKDFIKGLGLSFTVPFREQLQNRQVRFGGEGDGIWAEPVQPLIGRRPLTANNVDVTGDQALGKPIPGIEAFGNTQKILLHDLASWNDYKLVQGSGDGFAIQKRTNSASSWLDVITGRRSSGLVFAGDVSGGLALALKSFWQSYPSAMEVRDARQPKAQVKLWFWSPYSDAMDLRHYDTVAHGLDASYEDVQAGYSTPKGVARTSEIMIYPYASTPDNQALAQDAEMANNTPLLVTSPEYLHNVGAFGLWSLPDRSTRGKQWMEDQLDKAIAFYQQEIDSRNWYGYWNYGDVMHSYDAKRHTWKYDIGGFAWDNTELSTDIWLWYSYLRTGRADIFKMAEAMTRHTSEVDVYHMGPFSGLGSRHNVNHWGDGSKEVRESQAVLRRYYYYLTTDERTGDLMHETALNADSGLLQVDPLREILPKSQYPVHARFGPDWVGLVGNWMTEWERTGEVKWKEKILVGVNDFSKMQYGFFSGKNGAFGYNPQTCHIYQLNKGDIGFTHLATLMGGMEMGFELSNLINNKEWNRLFVQYCSLFGATDEEVKAAFGVSTKLGVDGGDYARLPAYAAYITKNAELAKRAWEQFLPSSTSRFAKFDAQLLKGPAVIKPMYEIPSISTNSTAQWCLNAIELLQLVGQSMPEHNAAWDK